MAMEIWLEYENWIKKFCQKKKNLKKKWNKLSIIISMISSVASDMVFVSTVTDSHIMDIDTCFCFYDLIMWENVCQNVKWRSLIDSLLTQFFATIKGKQNWYVRLIMNPLKRLNSTNSW